MNDFEKMQRLYEEGVGGAPYPVGGQIPIGTQSRGFSTTNMQYSKGLKQNASPISYGKGEIPTVSPGSTGKAFTTHVDNNNGDEETAVPEKDISNTAVLQELQKLQQEADDDGNSYAVTQLARLKQHINALSQ